MHVLNAVQQDFIATHPGAAPLEFVPTEYYNTTSSSYKQVIASTLDPKVITEWTGDGVVVPQITGSQAQAARQVFGHPILVWDNYPVNDYSTDRLFLGPYSGRSADLAQYLTGITANPMIEEEASKVALYGAGAYFWNPPGYDHDPSAAWLTGIKMIGGRVWPALKVFAENNYSSTLNSQESPALTPLIAAFWQAWTSGTGVRAAAARLAGYFGQMAAAPGQLRSGLGNPDFLTEAGPWLDKLGLYGQAGRDAVAMLLAERAGNGAAAASERDQLNALLSRIGAISQQVAPGVMDPFLAKAVQASEQSAMAHVTVGTGSPLARPGTPVTVTTTVTAAGSDALTGVRAGLTAPAGWQVAPAHPASLGTAVPGASVRAQWTVTAPGQRRSRRWHADRVGVVRRGGHPPGGARQRLGDGSLRLAGQHIRQRRHHRRRQRVARRPERGPGRGWVHVLRAGPGHPWSDPRRQLQLRRGQVHLAGRPRRATRQHTCQRPGRHRHRLGQHARAAQRRHLRDQPGRAAPVRSSTPTAAPSRSPSPIRTGRSVR